MASSYLERTLSGTSTNRKLCTFSYWVKRSDVADTRQGCIGGFLTNSSGQNLQIGFYDNGFYAVYYDGAIVRLNLVSSALARDVSAWYHVVVAIDTTQATTSNRAKMYVNGVQVTSFTTSDYPVQNVDFPMTNGFTTHIGKMTFIGSTTEYLDGLMANVYFIDGQQLDASSFGETDATTGIWKPKAYTGSYGTNGFFLKFENGGSLGTDSSGNGNNFTVNGTPTQTVDTPSNVFCTLNAIQNGNGTTSTLTNGNLTAGTNDNKGVAGTLGVNKGKWYWEIKNSGTQLNQRFGVSNRANEQDGDASPTGDTANVRSYVGLNYQKNYSASSGTTNNGFVGTNGAIYAFALDLDNGTLGRYVNGTLISTDTTLPSDNSVTFFPFTFVTFNNGNWNQAQFNFGNGVFGTTAISSPYSDGAGLGKFQYQPPTGYYALCTKNINVYG